MKKIIFTLAIACASLFSINANAQGTALVKGDNLISATIGFGSFSVKNIGVPPIAVSYENIVCEFSDIWSVGVGGFGGIFTQKFDDVHNVGATICAQGNVHVCPADRWDIYAGMSLGFVSSTVSVGQFKNTAGGFAWSPMIGARYFFNEKIGANLQVGGLGICNVGVTFRF